MSAPGASAVRSGIGVDMHRLVEGRPLILGGVSVPHPRGLEGDSDADVLTHAVLDALLGAAALGDIGVHFGTGRPEMMGISSLRLLERAVRLLAAQGFQPSNVDATLVAEAPRLGPHIPGMRAKLARVLGLPEGRVSVKGTTAKGMGWLGAGEGIACLAVATVTARRRPARGGGAARRLDGGRAPQRGARGRGQP
jgi:2-C-methyl-D-erythritol 2,4-cyclodiphosphate synthase